MVRPQIAGNADHLTLLARESLEAFGGALKELYGGGEMNVVFRRQLLLGQHLAVEVGDLERPQHVELQDVEIVAHERGDVRTREIDQVGIAAVRAAAQLPHNRKVLPVLVPAASIRRHFEKPLYD